jgi:hypothetical protein
VRKLVLGWLAGAVPATLGLLVARALAPGRRELELDVYVIVLGALALLGLLSWLRRETPPVDESLLQRALHRSAQGRRTVPELARLERVLVMSAALEFDLHYRLRPTLREIALARLAERGLRLDDGGPAVLEALGEELWEVVRPDRPVPVDRHAKGIGLDGVRRLVAQLEGDSP